MSQRGFRPKGPTWKIWTSLFVLGCLVLIAGGSLYMRRESRDIREERFKDLAAIAEFKISQIAQWRRERLADGQNLASSPFFRDAVESWLREPSKGGLKEDIRDRLKLTAASYDYADVLLVGREGRLLLSAKEEPDFGDVFAKEVIDQSVAEGRAVLSELYRTPSGAVYLDSVAPVVNKDGEFLAALLLRCDVRLFLYPLIQSWPIPSRTAETLLLRREGEEVVFLNDLRHRPGAALSFRLPLSETAIPAVRAGFGKLGEFEGKDYRGVKVLAFTRRVPDSSWSLAAKEDTSEILTEMRRRARNTAALIALLVLIGALGASLAYRRQKTRFYKTLYETEKSRRETQEAFRTTLYSIGDAVITTDTSGRVRVMNPVAERLTGWKEAEAAGKPLSDVFPLIQEETRARVENPVERVLREGIVVGLANHSILVARDGREIPIADAGAPVRDDRGQITGVVLVFRDQTRERQAEQKLRESEDRYRAIVENSQAGILIVGDDYRFQYANRQLAEILGYDRDDIIGRDFREFLDEESRRLVADRYVRRQRGEVVPTRYEFNVLRKDGEKRRVEIASAIVGDQRGRVFTVAQLLDITERKRAEEALRASEEKYRILHEYAGEAIFSYGTDLKLMEINRAACEYIGIEREKIIGTNIFELGILYPDDFDRAMRNLQKILNREKNIVVDKLRFKGRHGLYGTFQVTSTPILRGDEIIGVTNVCRDVTLEEQLYAALEASEKRYRFLFNAGNDAVFVYQVTAEGKPGKFIEVNDLACARTGFSRSELLDRTPFDLVAEEEKGEVEKVYQILSENRHAIFERTLVTRDGRRIPCEVSSHLFELNGVHTVLSIARDITERKKAEESLRASLKEKEVMLREIHHRVKNNLQIMSSLLRLQARQVSDEKAQAAFRESQTRIRLMAMIHEKLYQSGDFASIDFGDYIEKMVVHLFAIYQVDPDRISFQPEVRAIILDVNRAIPCALIVNELVSNALKYAFPGDRKGVIEVRMFRDEADRFRLTVRDSGTGMPESVDVRKPQTLGLQIVTDLVRQLEGTLELRRDGGTAFEIVF